jgi:hypothetical protein
MEKDKRELISDLQIALNELEWYRNKCTQLADKCTLLERQVERFKAKEVDQNLEGFIPNVDFRKRLFNTGSAGFLSAKEAQDSFQKVASAMQWSLHDELKKQALRAMGGPAKHYMPAFMFEVSSQPVTFELTKSTVLYAQQLVRSKRPWSYARRKQLQDAFKLATICPSVLIVERDENGKVI